MPTWFNSFAGDLFICDLLTILFTLAQMLFVLAVSAFALSAVDDLIMDIAYLFRKRVSRRLPESQMAKVSSADLHAKPEQYLAIMLPAWQEAGILYPSVSNMIETLKYKKVHIFIGTYPNDSGTQAETDRLCECFPQVHKIITPLPGPTCKADCLNAIVVGIEKFSRTSGIFFSAYILQDAEDVVHPLSLKLFNHYLPDYDLIQIPVFSLPRHWLDLTGGHYMDEFAEVHGKEIKTRQFIANIVPGAGVGTAYSIRVITHAAERGDIFNTNSLTEDYEFSFRLHSTGFKQIFARIAIVESIGQTAKSQIIATRELFPNRFWAAVRQKTRWIIGISLQGWSSLGWKGSWPVRFLYWRDRKMLFFSHAVVVGFTATVIFVVFLCYQAENPDGYHMAPLLPEGNPFWVVVYFNIAVLIYRLLQRCWWSRICYGWRCLPMMLPRYVWGALINYLATVRAIKIYLTHCITHKPIGWDKTTHDYPDTHDS